MRERESLLKVAQNKVKIDDTQKYSRLAQKEIQEQS